MPSMPATAKATEVATERAGRAHHPDVESLDLATIMRTLGDPLRLEMAKLLSDGKERPCGDLSAQLGLPASTGSYHMKLMREAGLTRKRAVGTQHLISLRRDDLESRFPGLVELIAAR
jgi:DNA-binding transcriptional ArsR family regulator